MIHGGDEFGKTKYGNNNTYCQDNELSWLSWDLSGENRSILAFARHLIRIRREHPVFRRKSFFQGRKLAGRDVKDIHWIKPDGKDMKLREWEHSHAKSLGMVLAGDAIPDIDAHGNKITDNSFLLLLNANPESLDFVMPKAPVGMWNLIFDTNLAESYFHGDTPQNLSSYLMAPHSLVLFSSSLIKGI